MKSLTNTAQSNIRRGINRKLGTCALTLCCAFLPTLLTAQTSPQGFFLDSWTPKSIDAPSYDTALQTTQPSTVTVTVEADSILTKVSRFVYGHNAAGWGGKLEQNTSLVNHVKNLAPHVIRWPGGNMSNDYFWQATSKATCPKDLPPTFAYSDLLYGSNETSWTMSLDSYYELLAKTNSTGIICVNYAYARYGTGNDPVAAAAKYAADWVRYDNGRTRYWEIGNENFGNWETGYTIDTQYNKDGQPATISGDLYGKHCKVFIAEMRKAALEVGNDIKIGMVAMDSYVTYNTVMRDWNKGMMKQVANEADFLIVHSYYTPYQENSTVPTVLNSAAHTKDFKQFVTNDLRIYANHDPLPVALTEWNIFAEGSGQGVSYINGMHATMVLGELIKNNYGQGSRWDFMNGWNNGDNHGIFADGEPGIARYTPRAPFFYMYYFQQFFGDRMLHSAVSGSNDVVCYASRFSSGQGGIVLVNKGTAEQVVNIRINDFNKGERYYYYLLTGGTDNGNYSRKVFVNGKTTSAAGGGPSDYATIKPYGSDMDSSIIISMPKWSTVYLLVESNFNPAAQAIQFDSLAERTFGDADYGITAVASSGLPVQLTSSNTKVATIINDSVHIVGGGTCTIMASQDGNMNYDPAVPVIQTLVINRKDQTLSMDTIPEMTFGDADYTPTATSSSGLPVQFQSSDPAVAAIVNGKIHIVGAGTSTITANQLGNANYNAATAVSDTLKVYKKNQQITIDSVAVVTFGDADFSPAASASSGLTVQYAVSDPEVATISSGMVHIVGAGNCSITASQEGNTNFNPAEPVTQILTVLKASQLISFPVLPSKTTGDPDFSAGATATSGLLCTYTSADPAVATLLNDQIHIVGAGISVITARQNGNENFHAASDVSQELIVSSPTSSENISGKYGFILFPNPVKDIVTINTPPESSTVIIYNATGIPVYSLSHSGGELAIPVSLIGRPGMYFVSVNSIVRRFCVIE